MAIELYKYNEKAYKNVIEHFEESNRTCVIHPTGTGKSFISLKFLYDNRDKKCLFMCPTDAIVGQIKTHIEESGLSLNDFPNLDFCLYASGEKVKNNKYDCIVFDEFHRMGADVWGKNVNELLDNNKEAKVLGLSATPIRYLDDNKNMADEIFDNDIASEMSLAEAIVKKILPTPNYISSIISFQEDIDKIQEQINNYKNKEEAIEYQKKLDQAKKMLENSVGLDDVFNNNIKNKNGKFIVFCRNYEHMKEMEEKCKEWFKKVNFNIEISDVSAKQNQSLNQYYISSFENNRKQTLKLLFSIDMLNEGLHVKDIDGVVMFRPTESPIVYFQQLGRALSVGHNENPLVFDIVNNYNLIDSILDLQNEVKEKINTIIEGRSNGNEYPDYPNNDELSKIIERFKILEENKNIVEILDSLRIDTEYTWDDWYKLAEAYYKENGNLEVLTYFRTNNGIDYNENGAKLGIWINAKRQAFHGKGTHKLTEEQIEKLKKIGMDFDNYTDRTWNRMYNLLKKYFKKHGNTNVLSNFKTNNGIDYNDEGKALGTWVSKQKQIYDKKELSQKRIDLLKEINFDFTLKCKYLPWKEMYKIAEDYFKTHGNLEVKGEYKTKEGYPLGSWIKNQRSTISPESEEGKLLLKIGMRFEKKISNYTWKEMYDYAQLYFLKNGNLEVPSRFRTSNGYDEDKNGAIKLGVWITNQRRYVNPESEEGKLLLKIGMRFGNIRRTKTWEEMYELAENYYNKFKNLNIPTTFKTKNGIDKDDNGDDLGNWLNTQKLAYSGLVKNSLDDKRIKLLEKIGIVWFSNIVKDKRITEKITKDNTGRKQEEIKNRIISILNKYDENSLPTKEKINNDLIEQLNSSKKK